MANESQNDPFDWLPETADDLIPASDNRYWCICVYGHVPDPADAADAAYFSRPQRTKFTLLELNPECPFRSHAERAWLPKIS